MTSPTLSFDRRRVSALAKALSAETGLPHAKAIACIARAAGYADGNALMGALKAGERQATQAAAPVASAAKRPLPFDDLAAQVADDQASGYLYTLCFPFISDDPDLGHLDLDGVAYEVADGGAVGGWGEHYILERRPISKDDLGRLAKVFGSTPDFFPCFAEGDDSDATP